MLYEYLYTNDYLLVNNCRSQNVPSHNVTQPVAVELYILVIFKQH